MLEAQDELSVLSGIDPSDRADFERRFEWVKLVERLAWQGLLQGDPETLAHHYLIPRRPAELGVSWCEAWQNYLVAAQRPRNPLPIALAAAPASYSSGVNVTRGPCSVVVTEAKKQRATTPACVPATQRAALRRSASCRRCIASADS